MTPGATNRVSSHPRSFLPGKERFSFCRALGIGHQALVRSADRAGPPCVRLAADVRVEPGRRPLECHDHLIPELHGDGTICSMPRCLDASMPRCLDPRAECPIPSASKATRDAFQRPVRSSSVVLLTHLVISGWRSGVRVRSGCELLVSGSKAGADAEPIAPLPAFGRVR
jgi:hypothetical protein